MSYDRTYRKTTTTRNSRPRYAPPPPPGPGAHNRQHSVLGYWVPLITIGTIAVGGLAAWIWSERGDDDEYPQDKPPRPPTGMGGPYPTQGSQQYPGPPPPPGVVPLQDNTTQMPPPVGAQQSSYQQTSYQGEASSYYGSSSQTQSRDVRRDDNTFIGRMTGAIKRTPSPQQFFDSASKQVMGGLAAAGSALGSIMEVESNGDHDEYRRRDDRDGFSDHERWSEEADERQRVTAVEAESGKRVDAARREREEKGKNKAKRTVAIVVSADFDAGDDAYEGDFRTEHGSILSHLPNLHDSSQTDLFVLIYAPGLKSLPPIDYQPGRAPSAMGSSYSEINTPAQTPGSELQSISPRIDATDMKTKHFDALYNQAQTLVSHPTHILPFTTADGYVHLLRHLAPQLVYISDTLSGREGETVAALKGWVGHTVLVVGDEGHGGLADTETETEDERGERKEKRRWWEHSSFVGLGKEVDVVDATRVGDDWARRVTGRE
ncbi:hypothetical protein M409DRAFT_52835 [Zasmidium cellare ATCC 36951]|uniref:Uncharacterized protein n=1 Tax=Zasmidium cellare ATCC 36951 TaxID=1080233 RepID=A0A6A6CSN2_ZASCE|nr:uncharacterized protein M409DRAFT_52835 [Zasmidium cellare ATCC 36951]KAF2168832.1 hypothetical protein M409DRAFT_52835 [Zasmidium cellare ATCC 36951]